MAKALISRLEPGSASQAAVSTAVLADIHRRYEAALRRSEALDFDDLIVQAIRLLENHPNVLAAIHERYRWITVDEYQDLNAAQHRLLRLLTAGGANLCVIGDPDQAIYGFRGADYRYFLSFDQDYPQAIRRQLGQNYRSSQVILDAATQVIARNPNRQALRIFSDFVDQVKLDIYEAPTDKAEAEYVVHQIEQMVGGTSYFSLDSGRVEGHRPGERSFADFAVLYRLSSQSRLLVEAFERSGIPFQTAGQTPFYAHKEVHGVMAFLWLLQAPASRPHLVAALAAGQLSLGPEALDRLMASLSKQGETVAAALQGEIDQGRRRSPSGEGWPPTLPSGESSSRGATRRPLSTVSGTSSVSFRNNAGGCSMPPRRSACGSWPSGRLPLAIAWTPSWMPPFCTLKPTPMTPAPTASP